MWVVWCAAPAAEGPAGRGQARCMQPRMVRAGQTRPRLSVQRPSRRPHRCRPALGGATSQVDVLVRNSASAAPCFGWYTLAPCGSAATEEAPLDAGKPSPGVPEPAAQNGPKSLRALRRARGGRRPRGRRPRAGGRVKTATARRTPRGRRRRTRRRASSSPRASPPRRRPRPGLPWPRRCPRSSPGC